MTPVVVLVDAEFWRENLSIGLIQTDRDDWFVQVVLQNKAAQNVTRV